ncbi:MAG: VWA domain-containing protein, partial [Spirochaetes bacterium]|nr:VWA domain-containing protein [Spirochaetota bacterium]
MWWLDFKNQYFLLLLIPWAGVCAWYIFGKRFQCESAIAVSSKKIVFQRSSFRERTYRFLPALRMIAVLLLIIALARPGKGVEFSSIRQPGIDIMIALDVSPSMSSQDFQPKNRLEVAKKVVSDFIELRKHDRMGLVIFSGEAYFQCPLTLETEMLKDIIADVDFDSADKEGTAIGEGVALAAARMADSPAKSKVILLLTDGMNNRGVIDPETAAKMCAQLGIKIYAVGIGKKQIRVPLFSRIKVFQDHYDPESLQKMAEITGGKFYSAESGHILWQNIKDIDRLEKSEFEVRRFYEFYDKFQIFLFAAFGFFLIEVLLRSVVYRKV